MRFFVSLILVLTRGLRAGDRLGSERRRDLNRDPYAGPYLWESSARCRTSHKPSASACADYARGYQILQSGSAGTAAPGPANAQNAAWSSFIAAFPQCRSSAASNSSFACLQQAKLSTTDFVNALTALQSITSTGISGLISVHGTGFMFAPMLDGASGFLPSLPNAILQSGKYAKIPFITGDVLDEGEPMRGLPSRVLG
jgi:hypothetical protein